MSSKVVEMAEELIHGKSRKIRTIRRVIDTLRIQQAGVTKGMITEYHPPKDFSEIDRQFRARFLSALKTLDLDYESFQTTMVFNEATERKKTGEVFTNASWQLFWAMDIINNAERKKPPACLSRMIG